MARNKFSKKKNKGKKNESKWKRTAKKPKSESNRDIKHISQYDEYYKKKRLEEKIKSNPRHRPNNTVSSSDEEDTVELDPISQLLGTFSNNPSLKKRQQAIESEDDLSDDSTDDVPLAAESADFMSDAEDEKSEQLGENSTPCDLTENIILGTNITDDYLELSQNDPFSEHLSYDLSHSLLTAASADCVKFTETKLYWPKLKNVHVYIPAENNAENLSQISLIQERQQYAKGGTVPNLTDEVNLTKFSVKQQLQKNIGRANAKLLLNTEEILTQLQHELFTVMNNYQDLIYNDRDPNLLEEIRLSYCLHVANHVLKTRTKIVNHNESLKKTPHEVVPDEFRDQGLVRPRVLILAPFRDSCFRIVNHLIALMFSEEKANVINRTRFNGEFSGAELAVSKLNPKPEDYQNLFKGNTDDNFKIGLTFTRKSIKLFSDFYSSDIIIASPLGLRLVIGAEGEKDRNFDFLSSVELLILDQVDVFEMQNWEHVIHIFDHLHLQPSQPHDTDFSRVRTWCLNGFSRFYRQTIIFGSVLTPSISAIISRKCSNYKGRVKIVNPVENGSVAQVFVQVPQVFQKFKTTSVVSSIDDRFDFFITKVLPTYTDAVMSGVLLYVPSYFDYVRIRNHFNKEDINFTQICEYSKDGKIARARDMFFHNETHFLLYSERFHFFRRIRIKGIKHVIFYQPPTYPQFYSEICNMMQEGNQNKFLSPDLSNLSVSVLYCQYDVHQLSPVVGTARAARMIKSEKDVHMFTTGK